MFLFKISLVLKIFRFNFCAITFLSGVNYCKLLYSYINDKRQIKVGRNKLIDSNGMKKFPVEIANILNNLEIE